ncbi:hypothetical protein J2X69_004126 [Algoriphagus sp. 4150]|uniref:Ig-like domain-containing protein n=1 Tax=Algoriphagus sp. 4150 TaxID=2817756 RepID=UPI0028622885|nr:Ig-like domain-containing protein [Algoriphagus sp. 4150]MDR7131761.1 hypothetical protein [Algoriphagus sp. 4150]
MKKTVHTRPKNRHDEKLNLLRKSVFIFMFLVGFVTSSWATDYYFSSSSGDDSRSAGQAQNSSTPWRSIDKLNSISSELRPGDRVLFKSGDTFYGSILVSRGGSSGNPITYTSYGVGEKPIITSMVRVSNWVSRGNGVYEASLSTIDSSPLHILSLNGDLMEVGRYPNAGSANDGYLTISGVNNNLSIQGENMPGNYVGGEIVIRKNDWIIDRHEISSNSGSTINFLTNSTTGYSPQRGYGYFVQNHINTLDQYGEWAYSKNDKKLYGYFGGQDPNGLDVQVATREHLINVSKYIQNLAFSNLSLKGANVNILNVENSGNVQVVNCQLMFAGRNGIYAHTTPDILVRNNEIDYSLSGGLFFPFGTERSVIEDNTIDHTMPFQGMASSSDLKGVGIYISSDANNSKVTRNKIYNTGFNGIHFGGNYTIIKNNLIDTYCLRKQDGAGIYTNSDGLKTSNNVGREIVGNIVLRGIGAVGGSRVNYRLAEGIYLDDNSMGIKVYNNTVYDVSGKGLYIHNNRDIEIYNNVFYKIPVQLNVTHDTYGDAVRGLRVEGNQFSNVFDGEIPYAVASIQNDVKDIGISDNNYFLDPFGVELMFRSQSPSDGPLGTRSNLQNWTSKYGFEQNSKKPEFNHEKFIVKSSSTIKESDFSSNLNIIAGTYNVTSELSTGIDGGVWRIDSGQSTNGSAFIQIGSVTAGDEILIEFDTKSTSINQAVELLLEKTFNQNQEGSIYNFVTSNEVKKVKLLLKARASASGESIVFRFPQALQGLLIDNLKISKVETEAVRIEDYVFFQYNYSNNAISYPLSDTYKNGKGEVFKGSVSIPAYGSVLLAKTEKEEEEINLPPSILILEPVNEQVFLEGDEILIKTEASDPEEKLSKVEFYYGGELIGEVSVAPFELVWNNAPLGSHELMAKVFDEGGLTAESSTVTVTVEAAPVENQAPSVAIVSPANSQSYIEGEEVVIKADASDPEEEISKVEFYYGGELIGEVSAAPFEMVWNNAPLGTHELMAKVFDEGGLTAESSRVTVMVEAAPVENQAPSVAIVSPANNRSYTEGEEVVIKVDASDPEEKLSKVEFYYGGELIGEVSAAPFEMVWNNAPLGSHELMAKVFDEGGLTAESSKITVTVEAAPIENQAPSVVIVSPTDNQSYIEGEEVVIKADASDPEDEISKVEFYYGEELIGEVSAVPYELVWNNAPLGSHKLMAKVFDEGGLAAESSKVTVTVEAAPIENQAPSVTIVSPANNQSYIEGEEVVIKADAFDPEDEISKVEFYYGGELIGEVSAAPFELVWNNAPLGSHELMAKVFDEGGLTAESSTVTVTVEAAPVENQAPSVALVSPTNNQSYIEGEEVVIKADAFDPEDEISKVEFYYGGELIGEVSAAPFELVWNNAPLGSHELMAKVFDEGGLTAESSRVTVLVEAVPVENQAPSVSIIAPSDNHIFIQGYDVVIKADASDPDGEISKVEFYYGEELIGEVSAAPYELVWNNAPLGSHELMAKAFDEGGLTAESSRVTVLVEAAPVENQAPSVALVSPANNQSYIEGEEVVIKADASDPKDEISKVEFYYGEELIGEVSAAPYELVWNNAPVGSHELMAKVFDEGGLTAESSRVTVLVEAVPVENQAPSVAIVSPTDNQSYTEGEEVVIKADASDPDGEISKVEFYYGGELIGEVSSAPYELIWNNAPVGSHELMAKVFDEGGLTAESEEVSILVIESFSEEPGEGNQAPSVVIVSPTDNQSYIEGEEVVIKAEASDPDGEISKVEFYYGGELIGEVSAAPYELVWNNAPLGSHELMAKVFDEGGLTAESSRVTVLVEAVPVENQAPSVAIVSPTDNQSYIEGEEVVIKADASDPDGEISKVEFYYGGELIGEVSAAPYELVWNNAPLGSHELMAKVFDEGGLTAESSRVTVMVEAAPVENQAPSVALVSPANNQSYIEGEEVVIKAEASDPDGEISKVEFYYGGELIGEVSAAPYELVWNNAPLGSHKLMAKAFDEGGLTAESEEVSILVIESFSEEPGEGNQAPSVLIVSPANNQSYTEGEEMVIKADASDPEDEISKVEFYYGDELIGEVSAAPYELVWNNAPLGSHKLMAKVYDDGGLTAESEEVLIQVIELLDRPGAGNQAPSVSIIAPSDNHIFIQGYDVAIKADASDPDGEISKVEFYYGEELIGEVSAAPYELVWNNAPLGSHKLMAKVYDDGGLTAESEEVLIQVIELLDRPGAGNQAPSVSIIAPSDNHIFIQGYDVAIKADASDPDGEISKVEFYYGEELIGEVSAAPYELVWNNAPVGSHELMAKVFDEGGLTAESSRVTVTVEAAPVENQAPSVSITAPSDNHIFIEGNEIRIKTEASDPDGEITKVEFYYGDELIGEVSAAPYELVWNNAPLGSHKLMAKAFDDEGLTAESEEILIQVIELLTDEPGQENQAPSISITAPTNRETFIEGQDIVFSANASDPEGEIAWVEFYYGAKMIGLVTEAPYQVIWKDAPVGTHELKTKVFDKGGLTAESTRITVTVTPSSVENQAPSISITAPTNKQSFVEGQDIVFSANASDPEGEIAWVEFYYGEQMIGLVSNAPYQVIWKDAPLGSHELKTKVFDKEGLTAESTRITVTVIPASVENQAPSISITAPTNKQSFIEGQDIVFSANASDPEGEIAWVEFYYGEQMIGLVSKAPYQVIWKDAPGGTHELKTKVFDKGGLTAESRRITVTVTPSSVKNQAPSISITAPGNKQSFIEGQDIVFSANASDPEGEIAWVEFYYGEQMIGLVSKAPYQIIWKDAPVGTHELKTKVFDKGGLTAESRRITVTVTPSSVENQAPSISITAPGNKQSFIEGQDIVFSANASDPEGEIAWVEFYYGEQMIGLVSKAPYQVIWKDAPVGTHELKTKVFDKGGLTAESTRITVTVKAASVENKAPSISITAPTNKQTFIKGQDIVFSANATDPEGEIAWVEFYYGDEMIALITQKPFEVVWKNAPIGNHILKTKVFDLSGKSAESKRVNIEVKEASASIESKIKLVSPRMHHQFISSEIIEIEVEAKDLVYDSIQVLVNGVRIASSDKLIFELPANVMSPGDNIITVTAWLDGVAQSSDWVSVRILATNSNPQKNPVITPGEAAYTYEIGPVPTSDLLNIYFENMYQNEDIEITIYDMNGAIQKVIETNTSMESIALDVKNYSAGAYLIRIVGKVYVYELKRFVKY